eukprot:Gregarina_sp_Pseudo_9__105@NODE_106_length_4254_cov_20_974140_g98_i0_p1_GENE_NODE_106_length_4254_cov_20_974140_g98_i0NODE_106_length_4254_cov_20_974140_g98_i0_p1_ORF_typecomplete_len1335_score339_37ABC_tran/PF00005_27/1_4e43ABC_tran/PF00005_27/1_3e37ABC_membrane/PF00664_23/2_4e43ABC_membrane/PF00664_23/3_3e40SMC_N/PF02463_19/34SMC_N/PF02463_19/2_4e07SMC_N/PF02463_19/38SMC_N/PF02463_19/3_3e05AAA_21/PF13304_6/3_8e05AAA_21/PF13304_6/3_1e05TniB/PF05621_11/0_0001TniB/PF05621_11/0_23TniB/PF05621_11/0
MPSTDEASVKSVSEHNDQEVLISKDESDATQKGANLFTAFRYSDKIDICLNVIGHLCGAGVGILLPLNFVVMGDAFGKMSHMEWSLFVTMCTNFLILGCASLVGSFICAFCLETSAERQVDRAKLLYFESVLRQEMGYFDTRDIGTLAADIETSTVQLRDGLGMKAGRILKFAATFVGGYVVGLWKDWRMALVLTTAIPLIGITLSVVVLKIQGAAAKSKKQYENAGAVAEEALPAIRTVAAFGLEDDFSSRFAEMIRKSLKSDLEGVWAKSLGMGLLFMFVFGSYALGWWYGGSKVISAAVRDLGLEGLAETGSVMTCFFAVLTASMSVGQLSPPLSSLAVAAKAASTLAETIERVSMIDPSDPSGAQPLEGLRGEIEFAHVQFAFPSRPQKDIYHDVSFKMNAGERVALVGPSGAGKSTVVQLIQRFYDPQSGQILIDGKEHTSYNLKWLRSHMALVSQEPKLFCDTVYENIARGKQGATQEEVIEAAKQANAHSFITNLANGYNTNVGQGGSLLSGGQKQRIAIARAILRDPSILILDEATSALDNQSEKIVQEALDKLLEAKKRTTIIIAHRLTTIRNADRIIVVENVGGEGSCVTEQGTHDELMQLEDGTYRSLVLAQQMASNHGSPDVEKPFTVDEKRLIAARLSKQLSKRASLMPDRHERLASRLGSKLSKALSLEDESAVEKGGELGENAPEQLGRKRDLFKFLGKDRPIMYIAMVFSAIVGAAFPFIAVMVAKFLGTFTSYDVNQSAEWNADEITRKTEDFALIFVYLAIVVGVSSFAADFCYGYTGERLVAVLRENIFSSMLHQDMEFFDNPLHNTGFLSSILSADCETAKMITGANLSVQIQNGFRLIAAVIIAFTAKPALAAVAASLYVIAIPAAIIQSKFTKTTAIDIKKLSDVESPAFVLNEAITNLKSVASYSLQELCVKQYRSALHKDLKKGKTNAYVAGTASAISESVNFFASCISFFYAGKLLTADPPELDVDKMMRSIIAIMLAGQGIAQATEFTTDSKKAKAAITNMMFVLRRKPKMDARDTSGRITGIEGDVKLEHLKFRYPGRPHQPILADVSFTIKSGETVALVGESGSGKSTVIQFLERFYDCEASQHCRLAIRNLRASPGEDSELLQRLPSSSDMYGGHILMSGKDITSFNLAYLRATCGLVGQEPVLFDMSVRDNIRNGKKNATEAEIVAAAKAANAHDFISGLDEAYDTNVGRGGGKLSGGQKQRIAIARAIVRDPKILLLDEATSALDPESEEVVQKALDQLMQQSKRTTIVIAHRLSTIRNADKIVVFGPQPGIGSKIVEAGSHDELMRIPGGVYRNLVEIAEGK